MQLANRTEEQSSSDDDVDRDPPVPWQPNIEEEAGQAVEESVSDERERDPPVHAARRADARRGARAVCWCVAIASPSQVRLRQPNLPKTAHVR